MKVCIRDEEVWRLESPGSTERILVAGHTLLGTRREPMTAMIFETEESGATVAAHLAAAWAWLREAVASLRHTPRRA
jgi:hypothetical protein